jgi:hypothetical protein
MQNEKEKSHRNNKKYDKYNNVFQYKVKVYTIHPCQLPSSWFFAASAVSTAFFGGRFPNLLYISLIFKK